jgi:hypothetical protein
MALVGLALSKRNFAQGFQVFEIKYPSARHDTKIMLLNHISNINHLDEHEFPKKFCSQA